VVLSWGGRGKGSGLAIQEREDTWIFTVRDRKILRVREFADKREALEAAG
jgi:ketosteroid isomerase-like protein